MKKVKGLPLLFTSVLLAILALCVFGLTSCSPSTEIPTIDPAYNFMLDGYDVTYDISPDGTMQVTEDLNVHYLGIESTGFIRDIPVNGGAQVKNVSVKKMENGKPKYVWYDVRVDDVNFISVDIGDHTNKYNKSESYRLTYTYAITNSVVNSGLIPLNPVGTGWGCSMRNVSVTLILPNGYTGAKCYTGRLGSTTAQEFKPGVYTDGRTMLTTYAEMLKPGQGISFDISFEKGKVKSYFDFTPYAFIIAAAVLIIAAVLYRIFVVGKNSLTPVVNYTAPNDMDPMKMGKLIDNKVNGEDVTAMIFYWASKGYVKINLDDKKNPVIIKAVKALPPNTPDYEQTLFAGMFKYGDAVRSSTLEGTFYTTVRAATAQLNAQTKGLYDKKSIVFAAVLGILSALLLGVAPMVLALVQVSYSLTYFAPIVIALIPSFIVFTMSASLQASKLKLSKGKLILYVLLIALLGAIGSTIYIFTVCHGFMTLTAKIILCIACFGSVGCSALAFNRTKEYTNQLNDIIGFKNFIRLAEKNQLETMIEEDPQFYYHILPYAQVLGVSSIWEDKFASITIEPPQWIAGNMANNIISFHILNNVIRSSMGNMSRNMVSRPASSGGNGGGSFGGGHGGFSGGGFGGGGGRGR
ncbi:MAG: DUF2207 domain-containing protein [Clostridia bacterium]|nr:DUF2207 domain-containing protein [Clostridia bacterium]